MAQESVNKTSMGLEENIAGLLCYVLGWLTGIVFLIMEKESRFVKFHAWQSILFSIAFSILYWVISLIPFVRWISWSILPLGFLVLWVLLLVKAYNREMYELPVIGEFARKQAFGA